MGRAPLVLVRPGARAAIVLGRSQRGIRVNGPLPVRHRASGGGAVLTGPWLLRAAVLLPAGHPWVRQGPCAAGRTLGEVHAIWLRSLGVDAVLHEGPVLAHWACYAGRAPGEVLVADRKVTGIAQAWRRSEVLLSAGTLLQPPPWGILCAAMGRPRAEADSIAASSVTLQELVDPALDPGRSATTLRDAIRAALARA